MSVTECRALASFLSTKKETNSSQVVGVRDGRGRRCGGGTRLVCEWRHPPPHLTRRLALPAMLSRHSAKEEIRFLEESSNQKRRRKEGEGKDTFLIRYSDCLDSGLKTGFGNAACPVAQLSSVAQCPMPVSTIERNEIHETLFVSCLMTPHNCPKPAQSNVAVGGSAPSVLGGMIISHNQSAETSDAEIQWRWLLACVTTNPPISHIGGLTAHHYLSTIC